MAKKKTPEINSSSTADIAFLLLCFFLMTTTMNKDDGISRRLPPMPRADQQTKEQDINKRNVVIVKINSKDVVFAGNTVYRIYDEMGNPDERAKADFVNFIKKCLTNTADDPSLPQLEAKEVGGKTYMVTRGVISMQNDRGTSYKAYLEVQDLLLKATNELRDDFCQREFKKPYAKASDSEKKLVKQAIPAPISEAEPKDVGGTNKKR